jgi:hypothetical protein
VPMFGINEEVGVVVAIFLEWVGHLERVRKYYATMLG